jgi:Fic-DOC domain mobile mystery protein B
VRHEYPEGSTPLDPDESRGLVPSLSTQAELNEFEFLNIAEAMRWAESSRRIRGDLLSSETLRLLHKRMFDKTWRWAGHYRITQKSIGVEAFRISSELHGIVEDAKCWLEFGSYPPDEVAARFHHRLVWIHPFPNGNGRHARLAADLLGQREGWPPFSWGAGLSADSTTVRRTYIDALRRADGNDFEPLVEFVRK